MIDRSFHVMDQTINKFIRNSCVLNLLYGEIDVQQKNL